MQFTPMIRPLAALFGRRLEDNLRSVPDTKLRIQIRHNPLAEKAGFKDYNKELHFSSNWLILEKI